MVKVYLVKKLPKNPIKGRQYMIAVNNPYIGKRLVTFKAVAKSGFGMWKIIENVKG